MYAKFSEAKLMAATLCDKCSWRLGRVCTGLTKVLFVRFAECHLDRSIAAFCEA